MSEILYIIGNILIYITYTIIGIIIASIILIVLIYSVQSIIIFIKKRDFIKKLLNSIENKKIVKDLIKINITKEKNQDLREAKFKALTDIENKPEYLIMIIKNFKNDYNPIIKTYTASYLGEEGLTLLLSIIKNGIQSYNTNWHKAAEILEEYDENKVADGITDILNIEDPKKIDDISLSKVINILISKNNKKVKIFLTNYFEKNYDLIDSSYQLKLSFLNFFSKFSVKKHYEWVLEKLKDTSDYFPSIRENAIKCLEKIGDVNTIEYIYPLIKKGPTLEIKKQAYSTVAVLQKNIPKNKKGYLSVTKNEDGELSFADDQSGELTINDK